MNFFKQLSETGVKSIDVKLTIVGETLSAIISLPNVKGAIPLTVSGSAEELDESFFDVVNNPLKKASGLSSNVEDFEKSLDAKPAAAKSKESDEDSKITDKPATKEKPVKKTPPYKHQKLLDGILTIVNTEGYVLSEENKEDLLTAVNKLLVMDSKNEVGLEWEAKIKELGQLLPTEEVEEKEEVTEEAVPETKEEPVAEAKKETPAVKEKVKKESKPLPPAPKKEEPAAEEEEDDKFSDDNDLDMDFEDFFN